MNNESPLIPQGSFLEQKNKGRTRVKIAVFVVLAIHGIGVMALLMQGCGKEENKSGTQQQSMLSSNPPPAFETPSNIAPPVQETNGAPASTNPPAQPVDTNPPAYVPSTTNPAPVPAPVPAAASEHKIAKGDTLGKLAKQYHVSLKALTDANPGVDASRLQIGQTIKIPASSASGTSAAPQSAGAGTEGANGTTYTVKSGDNLTKIAANHGVTLKAIRAANKLTTDRIRVGQTLKIPAKSGGAAATPSTPGGSNAVPQ
jgi:LysM repeat protein